METQKPAPAAAAKPTLAQEGSSGSGLVKIELEHNIPVKQPDAPAKPALQTPASPAPPAKQFVEADSPADKELEGVLKDVSRDVRDLAHAKGGAPKYSLRKLL